MTDPGRRRILQAGTLGVAGLLARPLLADPGLPAPGRADDEQYWKQVAGQYDLTSEITNLENGYWGVMSRPVLDAYQRKSAFINRENTWFARRNWGARGQEARQQVADFLGVALEEVALTRGATEALQVLIGGYNKLKPGDAVLCADLDYSEMKTAMHWLAERRGVRVIQISFPEPASHENVVELYKRTLDANPDIRMMLMTHLNNWTGLIAPVQEVASMAKERGIDVILDAAHSVGQVQFDVLGLGCDFVGVNLHKWVGAPIGCGVAVIRKGRVTDIDPFMGKAAPDSPDITDRIDSGTSNFAATMAISDAVAFHGQIGTGAKQARLKYLRDIWVNGVRGTPGIQILTPDDPASVCALTSFRLKGETTTAGNNEIMRRLAVDFGVLTVRRTGPAAGDCVRVTPSVYNTPADMEKLARALKTLAGE